MRLWERKGPISQPHAIEGAFYSSNNPVNPDIDNLRCPVFGFRSSAVLDIDGLRRQWTRLASVITSSPDKPASAGCPDPDIPQCGIVWARPCLPAGRLLLSKEKGAQTLGPITFYPLPITGLEGACCPSGATTDVTGKGRRANGEWPC